MTTTYRARVLTPVSADEVRYLPDAAVVIDEYPNAWILGDFVSRPVDHEKGVEKLRAIEGHGHPVARIGKEGHREQFVSSGKVESGDARGADYPLRARPVESGCFDLGLGQDHAVWSALGQFILAFTAARRKKQ